ncbi:MULTISPECIES: helix-turn-helix domain-containing protein [unclassified Mesorhizobium]|uniref:helix-turn-helix domain-containing protein n=1 Tax=unclassified Mesorhizobium TaxID=325217 RepID=UPI00167AAC1E|nr:MULTISPECIES: helix-turn-helix domain-containing protein [unclassified Mesorhizobium]
MERYPKSLSGQAVADLAWELDLSRATLYRTIKLFRAGVTVSSLMDRKRGRRQGHRALDKDREALVRRTIESPLSQADTPVICTVVRQVQIACAVAGLASPNWRTLKSRVEEVDLRVRGASAARARSSKLQRPRQVPFRRRGSLNLCKSVIPRSTCSLSTKKASTARTALADTSVGIFSRMVTGFYLPMEAPSRLSTSLCIWYSVFDKTHEVSLRATIAGALWGSPRIGARMYPEKAWRWSSAFK